MKKEFIDAIYDGEIVKVQEFETAKGNYKLVHVRNGFEIFFYKYLNDEMVECCNLSTLEGRKVV